MSCILHPGYKQPDGYGQKKYKKRVVLAHRLAYALANDLDVFTMGGTVMHSCDNPSCINHAHLSLGTMKLNADDCVAKRRHVHMLSDEAVAYIRNNIIIGTPYKPGNTEALASLFGVSRSAIGLVVRRKTYAHLP